MAYNRKRPADTQEDAWVAAEDVFVLQQAKKKAAIRVKEGRAKPIDWLAVTLRFVDPTRNPFDDEVQDSELDIVDPQGVLDGLDEEQLRELEKDVDMYATLEKNGENKEFWLTIGAICKERRQEKGADRKGRGQDKEISKEVDRLFGSKSLTELTALEQQIRSKLRSNEPIDVEYWEGLLKSLVSWKAKAKLRQVSESIVQNQLQGLRTQQAEEAAMIRGNLRDAIKRQRKNNDVRESAAPGTGLDPEPFLRARAEDKALQVQNEENFLRQIVSDFPYSHYCHAQ